MNRIDPLGREYVEAGSLGEVTVTAGSNPGAFSDIGGSIGIEQDPPNPVTLPGGGGPPPPPPPPHMDNVNDVVRYWDTIRDWIASKGKCGDKLGAVIGRMNDLMKPGSPVFFHDMRDQGVPNMNIGQGSNATTPAAWFATHPGAIAFTWNQFVNDLNQTFLQADIFFSSDFFTNPQEDQAATVFHELLARSIPSRQPPLGAKSWNAA